MEASGGRVALITGASRGIGKATAEQLSLEGYRVVLVARDRGALEEVAEALPGPALVVASDVTDPRRVEEVFATTEQEWGPVEVLVANAGAATAAALVDTTDEDWQQILDLNLTAPFRCIRRALPPMLDRGWGRIVVVASVASKHGESMISAYTASKHGICGLTKNAAVEYANENIRVNAVCPGAIMTPLMYRETPERQEQILRPQAMSRFGDPREVAAAVVWLSSDDASFVTGVEMPVDAGSVAGW